MKVEVLGTIYTVVFDTLAENKKYEKCDGYCEHYLKQIHVRKHTHEDTDHDEMTISDDAMHVYQQKVIRHELIHAFMYESGLDVNSNNIEQWAMNEEMIDWMAIQMPKITAAYEHIVGSSQIEVSTIDGDRKTIILSK